MPVGLKQECSRYTKVYNGLINQGATCYLNSALQVLYMTEEFREAVERLAGTSNNNGVLHQLHKLFEKLRGEHKSVTTVGMTKCLKINNVCEQQDAIEWIENILNAVSSDASEVYNGTLRKSLRCVGLDHCFNEDNSFFSIPLAMDTRNNIFNVVDGLRAFFQTTRFDEDDWLYCDDCDEKTDTEISLSIQKYPTILILHLKRFYFDYMRMEYQKNSCLSHIPLQITYFEGHTYDLYAVINHSGVYGSGHYYAYIKSIENNRWYCFNDSQVTEIRPTENNTFERSSTAYIILYRKSEPLPSSTHQEEAARGNKGPISVPEGVKRSLENQDLEFQDHDAFQSAPKRKKIRSKKSFRVKSCHACKRAKTHHHTIPMASYKLHEFDAKAFHHLRAVAKRRKAKEWRAISSWKSSVSTLPSPVPTSLSKHGPITPTVSCPSTLCTPGSTNTNLPDLTTPPASSTLSRLRRVRTTLTITITLTSKQMAASA